MATARTRAIVRRTRSLTAGRRGRPMAERARTHRTAVAPGTRFSSWRRMAPTRVWLRIQKAAEQRRVGLPTAKRSTLQIALRKITERTARFSQPDCEWSGREPGHGR